MGDERAYADPEAYVADEQRSGPMADEYWFCLEHHRVETRDGCKNADRLGPYPTEAEAARALDKVEERNEAWENDPDWNDDDLED